MARSNNNNKLKAFVRFDGSGRIIPSSLIVQAFKPKVGNYKEIDAKECCNYTPTTTSTTTVLPTTTTTTTQVQSFIHQALWSDLSEADACSGTFVTIYTSVPSLGNSVAIYLDAALTQPVNYSYIASGGTVWSVLFGALAAGQNCPTPTTTTTTTEFPGYYTWIAGKNTSAATACAEPTAPVYSAVTPLTFGVILYEDTALTIPAAVSFYATGGIAYEVNGSGSIISETLCP